MDGGRREADGAQPDPARPVIVCIPSTDRPFCDRVRALAGSLSPLTPRALELALRSVYPAVLVRPSVLTGTVLITWYVYRDRAFPGRSQ